MKMLARVTIGLWLWAFAFSLLYALHGIGCARSWDAVPLLGGTMFRWTMVVTWLGLALCGGAIILWATRETDRFARRLGITSSIAGLAGILIVGSPTALASSCL